MELILKGHEDLYAVEQLQMSLFPMYKTMEGQAVSSLHRGKIWLTAVTTVTLEGKTCRGVRRAKTKDETVRLRRQLLQQSYYAAALPFLHIGADLISLCSMLRIPVCLHNVPEADVFRPAVWNAFGMDKEGQDYRACAAYGPMYKNIR